MADLTPRLQTAFEKTRPICFGRFMVDVPESVTVAWGPSHVPITVTIYPGDVAEVDRLAQNFIDELKREKAINHDNVPMLLSVVEVAKPRGRLVTGYENFQSINGLKINGYFRMDNDGVIVNSRPLRDDKDRAVALINSIAGRLRPRAEEEIPSESGNCIEYGFLIDALNPTEEDLYEHISIGFRFQEFPDAHFSIYVAPSNPHDPERDSLEAQFKRIKEDMASTPEAKKVLDATKYFRESPRQIHDWKTGYEVLMRSPDEEGSRAHHDFAMKFIGVPHDPFRPYADIQFQTGVADNAAGATTASLSDEEAIAIWDKITSTIRVRPTKPLPQAGDKAAAPRVPLGEQAVTGRTCPQTGWWQAEDAGDGQGGRHHLVAGERMPHVTLPGQPSFWQKLKGERPSHRRATAWKLVAYDDAPARKG